MMGAGNIVYGLIKLPDGDDLHFYHGANKSHMVFWRTYYGTLWSFRSFPSLAEAQSYAEDLKCKYELAPEIHIQTVYDKAMGKAEPDYRLPE
jgi:hypothetical protein